MFDIILCFPLFVLKNRFGCNKVTIVSGVDKLMYANFIQAAACRVGQLLNVHDITLNVGVPDDTAKRWLLVPERSEIIFYLRPYSENLLKRTIKTPRMNFFDAGLAAYLTKYSSAEILMNGSVSGFFPENCAVAELRKTWLNFSKECLLHYYREMNSNEIDLTGASLRFARYITSRSQL